MRQPIEGQLGDDLIAILRAHRSQCGKAAQSTHDGKARPIVSAIIGGVEALIDPAIVREHWIRVHRGRHPTAAAQRFGERGRAFAQRVMEIVTHAVNRRRRSGHERGESGERARLRGHGQRERFRATCESIEMRAGPARIPGESQAIGAQRIDGEQKNVETIIGGGGSRARKKSGQRNEKDNYEVNQPRPRCCAPRQPGQCEMSAERPADHRGDSAERRLPQLGAFQDLAAGHARQPNQKSDSYSQRDGSWGCAGVLRAGHRAGDEFPKQSERGAAHSHLRKITQR
jgi:hypothetical protein